MFENAPPFSERMCSPCRPELFWFCWPRNFGQQRHAQWCPGILVLARRPYDGRLPQISAHAFCSKAPITPAHMIHVPDYVPWFLACLLYYSCSELVPVGCTDHVLDKSPTKFAAASASFTFSPSSSFRRKHVNCIEAAAPAFPLSQRSL